MENPYARPDENPCTNQAGPGYDNFQPRPLPPDNYLIWAILGTICCCLPIGIVSIIYAARVNGLYSVGDYGGAMLASRNAKRWILANVALTVSIYVIYVILYAVMGVAWFLRACPPGTPVLAAVTRVCRMTVCEVLFPSYPV